MATTEELTTNDAPRWRAVLPIERSVFGSVEFARIQESHRGANPRLFVANSAMTTVAYPYSLKPVADLPFVGGDAAGLFDVSTPEYTGPITSAATAGESDLGFAEQFSAHCISTGVVSDFAHLHPWHAEPGALVPDDVRFDREIVYVDLTLDEDSLWRDSLRAACRKNVNRAVSEEVAVHRATDENDLRDFHRIYTLTMDRVGADPQYRFTLDFFRAFHETMPDNADVLLARRGGRVIAGILVLHDDADVYSYLGGADLDFSSCRPSNLLYFEAMLSGKARGKRRFVLGGGYQPNDGVFRFKATFSPLRAAFSTMRRVHLGEEYASLCEQWSSHYGTPISETGFFPPYRHVPADPNRSTRDG